MNKAAFKFKAKDVVRVKATGQIGTVQFLRGGPFPGVVVELDIADLEGRTRSYHADSLEFVENLYGESI